MNINNFAKVEKGLGDTYPQKVDNLPFFLTLPLVLNWGIYVKYSPSADGVPEGNNTDIMWNN